ncbi:type 4 prepilin-like proteins leader peptide-processing enzyme [Arenimonas soli]|uniref:Prepilin leader peptidase/N-methyltransferase n=1 Tax=Arenimonas soli TaxID=2269504 RepID=A0ABQ1HP79_9GAMM|nr:A24 family peptidase [Arenimonas soli]GGA85028.1 type 4 prepilin-like proteins leader peptide-processing enzyme [Arenimonas soli]
MFDALLASAALSAAVALAFGMLVGSFLNVVILRLPPRLEWQWRRDSREILEQPEQYEPAPPGIVVQRSACPKCGHKLAPWENIPVVSFLLLRGKCRGCGSPISWQYPLVELATGLLFAACIWRFGVGAEGLAALVFTGLLVAMSGIDLRTTLLPDQLTYPLLWIGLGLSTMTLFVSPVQAIFGALAGYLSLWSVYWAFKLLTGKEGMGHGDFKLLAALGAWCGVAGILPIVLMSSFIGAIVGSLWIGLRGSDRATPIPFGPYLAAAGWVQLMWGPQLLQAYRDFSGLN